MGRVVSALVIDWIEDASDPVRLCPFGVPEELALEDWS